MKIGTTKPLLVLLGLAFATASVTADDDGVDATTSQHLASINDAAGSDPAASVDDEDHRPSSRELTLFPSTITCKGEILRADARFIARVLNEGEYLCNGDHRLGLIHGRLFLFNVNRGAPRTQISWHAGRGGKVSLRTSGQLAVVDNLGGGALWTSQTTEAGSKTVLVLDQYGTAMIREDGGKIFWAAHTPGCVYDWNARTYNTTLQPDQRLFAGQFLCENFNNKKYVPYSWTKSVFGMDNDGNFFAANKRGQGGSAGTSGKGYYAVMQGDGNLVVYGSDGNVLWASGTNKLGTFLELTDGNAELKFWNPRGLLKVIRNVYSNVQNDQNNRRDLFTLSYPSSTPF